MILWKIEDTWATKRMNQMNEYINITPTPKVCPVNGLAGGMKRAWPPPRIPDKLLNKDAAAQIRAELCQRADAHDPVEHDVGRILCREAAQVGGKKGGIGGLVESEEKFSHKDNCWVYYDPWPYNDALVNGWICGSEEREEEQ